MSRELTIDLSLFPRNVPFLVVRTLQQAYEAFKRNPRNCHRLRIYFGDPDTGVASYCREGYIGKSTGYRPQLLMLHRRNSQGGDLLSPSEISHILRIEYSNRRQCGDTPLYSHRRFDGRPLGVRHIRFSLHTATEYHHGQEESNETQAQDRRYRKVRVQR